MPSSATILAVFAILVVLVIPFSGTETPSSSVNPDQQNHSSFLWNRLLSIPDERWSKLFLPPYIDWKNDLLQNENITTICRDRFRLAINDLQSKKIWATKLFNSWANGLPSGLLIGTMTDYGDYDQCMSIQHNIISPRYCLVDISFPVPEPQPEHHNLNQRIEHLLIPASSINSSTTTNQSSGNVFGHLANVSSLFYYLYIRIGVCLPDDCSNHDIRTIVDNGLKETGLKLKTVTCTIGNGYNSGHSGQHYWKLDGQRQRWKPNFIQTVAMISIIFLISVTLFAAIYDRFVMKKSSTGTSSAISETILLWFSPIKNIRKIISSKSNDELHCIHGIRFITLAWIIIGHTLEWNPMNLFRESFMMTERMSSLQYQPLFKAHYSVDTFFYLSGLLSSYVTFKYTQGDYDRFRYLPYILLRYLRLTPQLIAFMLLLSLMPAMYDGPLWSTYMTKATGTCSNTWWHNLIYMQNLIDVKNICGLHTWYLAADMQLHWMSVILVPTLLKNQFRGVLFTKCLILLCMLIGVVTILWQKLPPGGVITTRNDFLDEQGRPSDFLKFFYGPWNHANVFFIGFIFGSHLYRRNIWKGLLLRKRDKYFYWLVAFAGYLFCIYSTSPWLYGRQYDPIWSAILFPLNRTIWALVLTLVIWLCVTNNGSIIGRLLAWSGFRPLSRITYSVYLTHVLVFYSTLGTRRNLIDQRNISIWSMLSATIILSYIFGFIFTVLVEAPLIHFLEYLKHNLFTIPTIDIVDCNGHSNNNNNQIHDESLDKITSEDEKKQMLQLSSSSSSNNHESNV